MESDLITSYIYQYSVGSVLFIGGLVIARMSGALDFHDAENRRTTIVLVAGMIGFAIVHALLQFVFPFWGE